MARWLTTISLLAVCSVTLGATERPDIVLVMADDQGWGDMAYQGHPVLKTPHFDAMAREGLRFDRFYAAAPVCSPTRGSVMTGRHPNRFGCFSWGHALRPQEITVAEALKRAGYTTGHFGKWHLGSVRRGSPVNPGASGFDEWLSAPNFFDNDPILSRRGEAVPMPGESSMVTVDAALEFIRACVQEEKRFLAVVWFGSPHGPHRALDADRELYPDQPPRLQHFYGEITAMDRAFGKLRRSLGELGIRESTLLWYTSDNGALKGVGSSGGHRGRKGQVYEGGHLVPAILEWPERIRAPRSTAVRCNSSDIYPTLLEVAGVDLGAAQPPLDGVSLVPLLEGRMRERPRPMGFWHHPTGGIRTPSREWMTELLEAQRGGGEPDDPARLRLDAGEIRTLHPLDRLPGHSAWIDGDWKLHRIAGKKGETVRTELYDLAGDPKETTDLAAREPEREARLLGALEAWQRSVVRSLNGEDYRETEPSPATESAESERPSERPSFVLVIADDISHDDIPFSEERTPHVNRLAARGMRFSNAYLTTSSCSPSRCSIITGRYPHNTGAPELHTPLPEGQVLFPEMLKEAGYYTVLSGKHHMGRYASRAFEKVSAGRGPGREGDWVEILRERPKDRPFFCWFASTDAHRDWQQDGHAPRYAPEDVDVPPYLVDGPKTRKDLADYWHEVSRVDHFTGEVARELERQGVLDSTVLIFMADNGRPFPRCKTRLYDSGIKTPFVVHWPQRVRAGVATDSLVSAIDIAPTLLELAGVPKDPRIQGVSFAPVLEDPDAVTRDVAFAEHNWHVYKSHERMVRTGRWLYIRNQYPDERNLCVEGIRYPAGEELWERFAEGRLSGPQMNVVQQPCPPEELYDVREDPRQLSNLALHPDHVSTRQRLASLLDRWVEETGDTVPTDPTPDRDARPGEPPRSRAGFRHREMPGDAREARTIDRPGPVLVTSSGEASTGRPLVGVYYYPWYRRPSSRSGGRNPWRQAMRLRLEPPQEPRAGLYDSSDPRVIGEHIRQSVRGGIDFWAVSWWGPDQICDRNLGGAILKHPDASKLKYAILYESTGRLGTFAEPHYRHWRGDLAYMARTYFDHPSYLRIRGRPVLFVYLTREYFRGKGDEALRALREEFPEVYLVGDEVFGPGYRSEWARRFDAVTAYDVYGQSVGRLGGTRRAIAFLAANYRHAREEAAKVGVGFMPTIAPGYNDTAVRRGHPGRARYFTDRDGSAEGDIFRAMIRDVALPNLDPRCDRILMVTSFNEWYEDTQIEATSGKAPPSDRDDSSSGTGFTGGQRYEDYGELYLDILREEVRGDAREAGAIDRSGPVPATEEEVGWTTLFDGRSLDGWHVKCRPQDRDKMGYWRVERGTITAETPAAGEEEAGEHGYIWLLTDREFGDFELRLEVQTYGTSTGNSGVQVRSRYDDEAGWLDGPQVDIHPPGPWRCGFIYDETREAKVWLWPDVGTPRNAKPSHAPEGWTWRHADDEDVWNDVRIVCRGTRIRTIVNGVPVADHDGAGRLDDEAHRRHRVGLEGHVGLQIHPGQQIRIRFRDIRIRSLP